jgi:hypothetical protein
VTITKVLDALKEKSDKKITYKGLTKQDKKYDKEIDKYRIPKESPTRQN